MLTQPTYARTGPQSASAIGASALPEQIGKPRSLAIFDARLQNLDALIADVGTKSSVVVVEPHEDGIARISNALKQFSGVEELHVICHGTPGALHLGSTPLTTETLAKRSVELSRWPDYLSGRDMLLYGCEVAKGTEGFLFLQKLRMITGANIAASTRKIGNADGFANWGLERTFGDVTALVLFSDDLQATYRGTFQPTVALSVNKTEFIEENGFLGSTGDPVPPGVEMLTLTVTSSGFPPNVFPEIVLNTNETVGLARFFLPGLTPFGLSANLLFPPEVEGVTQAASITSFAPVASLSLPLFNQQNAGFVPGDVPGETEQLAYTFSVRAIEFVGGSQVVRDDIEIDLNIETLVLTFFETQAAFDAATSPFSETGDTVDGTSSADILDALGGDDVVRGLLGNDTLVGNLGNDTLEGGAGADRVDGGADVDTASYAASTSGVTVNLSDGTASGGDAEGDDLISIENLLGSDQADDLTGSSESNTIDGSGGNDLLFLQDGGDDDARGGDGNDGIFFGAAFDAADTVDGGAGDADQLALQGDYSGGLIFGANSSVGIEQVILLPGSITSFGAPGTEFYDYSFTLIDENVGAGEELAFQANQLRAGEDFTLDASAETDGSIFTFAGLGAETITGSQDDDSFFFGTDRFGPDDRLDGQSGTFDSVGLQGDYSDPLIIGADQVVNIDILALLSSTDPRFGVSGGTLLSYNIVTDDGNVAAGASMGIVANGLIAGETFTFDGSAETDGAYIIFSGAGNDTIEASQGVDTISGGGGADTLTGNAGDDIFLYSNPIDSTPGSADLITDFTTGDLVNLSALDANVGASGNQAFTFIGDAAFGSSAGELRAVNTGGNNWTVQGDTDGDGTADLEIDVTTADGNPLDAGDFIL